MNEISTLAPAPEAFEDLETTPVPPIDKAIDPIDWGTALNVLKDQLANDGKCSAVNLTKELTLRGVKSSGQILTNLRADPLDEDWDPRLCRPTFEFTHKGRTFYSAQALEEKQGETEIQAEKAAEAAPIAIAEVEPVRRRNRQEEARLGQYIKTALEDIYDSACRPEQDANYVFDVHNERGGSDFENVDLIAFHWRSESVVETITVEAKLEFSSRLVQQANNYRRFSTRTWIAVPCTSLEAESEFRDEDALLFDYVIESGLGILACRKSRGRSYEVFPIQWPRANHMDPVAVEQFSERYRPVFEEAMVVERKANRRFPKVR